jgi:hypothetical protein
MPDQISEVVRLTGQRIAQIFDVPMVPFGHAEPHEARFEAGQHPEVRDDPSRDRQAIAPVVVRFGVGEAAVAAAVETFGSEAAAHVEAVEM